jgi:squalene synthase HpnD
MSIVPTRSAALAPMPIDRLASGSSFYTAMRILPRDRREAMLAVYAFCRAVDDIADDLNGPRDERAADLAAWREAIDELYDRHPPALVTPLVGPVAQFGLRRSDFLAVIDGMETDVRGDVQAPTEAELDLYCDRVASAVGRLSVKIFGLSDGEGIPLAHHLGRALQLTNILRDLDEDAAMNRLYLPRELLVDAGIAVTDPRQVMADVRIDRVCRTLTERARDHFQSARLIMDRGAREHVRCPRVMADVYEAILDRLAARGWAQPRERVHTPKLRALLAVFRYGII